MRKIFFMTFFAIAPVGCLGAAVDATVGKEFAKVLKTFSSKQMGAAWDKVIKPTKNIPYDSAMGTTAGMTAILQTGVTASDQADIFYNIFKNLFGDSMMTTICAIDDKANTAGECGSVRLFYTQTLTGANADDGAAVAGSAMHTLGCRSTNVCTGGLKRAMWVSLGTASAKGDPHVTNIQGEKFDILKSGTRVMVQYPRETSDPSLVVTAQIVRADAKWCENTFIEKVEAHGRMLGTSVSFTMGKLRSPGPFRVTVGEQSMSLSEVIKKQIPLPTQGSYISGEAKQMTLQLAPGVSIGIKLVKHSHFQFFNLDVSGLSNLPGEVGGLLGIDDHSGEAHEDCKFKTHKTKMAEDDDSSDLASFITSS